MNISVIIPTYNGMRHLPKLFEILQKQTISFELVVIDSSSTDGTGEFVKSYADKLITIRQSEFDHGGTRTIAAKEASGDILIFLTQDALPKDTQSLAKLLKAFEKNGVVAAYGRQLPHSDASLFAQHLRAFNYTNNSYIRSFKDSKQYGLKTAFLSDSFSAYKKSAVANAGWFQEGTIFGEDMHLVARLLLEGGKVAYVAEAMVYHSHNYSVLEDFQRYFDTGVFHARQSWLIEKFGKAEGEGRRYVQSELNSLLSNGAYLRIPEFFLRNAMKLLGYKLGKNYEKLPRALAVALSMHKSWWKRWA